MKNLEKRLDRLIAWVLPVPFIGAVYLSVFAFVLDGHRHEWFRRLLSIGGQGAAALVLFAGVVLLFRREARLRGPILLAACIPLAFALVHLWALVISADRGAVLRDAAVNGCYLVSICCAFILILAENRVRSFLKVCRYYALAVSPVILYYCVRFYLPSAAYGVANLGVITYMSIAYMLLHLCVFLLLELLLYGGPERRRGTFPWSSFGLFALFSIAITLSGTKGTILCLLTGCALFCLYAAAAKRYRRDLGLFALTALAAVALFSFALYPDYGVESRVVTFVKETTSEHSVEITQDEIQQVDSILQHVQTDGEPIKDVVEYVKSGKAEQDLLDGKLSQEEYGAILEMSKKLNNTSTGSRKYLWSCAFAEIKSAPLTGHGPLSYQIKYGTYPHNFFLEVATDFGLPAMVLVLLLGAWVFIRLFRRSLRGLYFAAFTLYVLTFLFQKMVSGSIYNYDVFFQYGFCILIAFLPGEPERCPVEEMEAHEQTS